MARIVKVAAGSKNYDDDKATYYVGNSLFTGGDESAASSATLGSRQ